MATISIRLSYGLLFKKTLASQFLVPMLRSEHCACSNGVFQVSKISLNFFLMVQKLIGSNNEVNFERVFNDVGKIICSVLFSIYGPFLTSLDSRWFALIYLDIVHTFFVRNGVIYTVFFANCSPCFEKTIWPTINLIQLNDAKFITLLVCQTDKDKKREKSKYISNLAELKKK